MGVVGSYFFLLLVIEWIPTKTGSKDNILDIYLVGGAVRDKLLGLAVEEKDWLVVGATPDEMLAQGFVPVGKEFPVFLHPKTHEEYALARTERKIGKGYKGFTFYASPDVTLEEDLKRRDLTINAMAETADGKLIDPYHGLADLKAKRFRHVSDAFQEDPVRVLRVARLATKFPDFRVAPDTQSLMKKMVKAGEVDALVPERVWQEWVRALENKAPFLFFSVLLDCDALPVLFPEIKIDGEGLVNLKKITLKTDESLIRFAALMSDLSVQSIDELVRRYRIPKEFSDLALLVSRNRKNYRDILSVDESGLLALILSTDVLRRPQRFEQFQQICDAIEPGITAEHQKRINKAILAVKSVNIQSLQAQNLKGEAFANALEKLRLEAIRSSYR